MPITLEYDREENVVHTTATDAITFSDIAEYFSTLLTLDLRPGYCVLADYCEASFRLPFEEIERMAAERKNLIGDGERIRIAVYCRDDRVYGLGRIYRALLDDGRYSVMIFRTQQEAESWLGL